ncbi:hypothetical protein CRUP_038035 [Coryphaenoides rupestris]|nr:hypothetical protein CRUP_038035 [Coryphaenoides rupestris]
MSSSHTLCERCALFCRTFCARLRRLCKDAAREVDVFVTELAHTCVCLVNQARPESRSSSSSRSRRSVSHLSSLPLLSTGDQNHALSDDCFEALNDLTASGNGDLQQAASTYYLYLSHRLETPLPISFMEPLGSLLLSSHPDVQKTTCLALVNLLVKRNACMELVLEMGMLPPLLEMVRCGDTVSRCHACACLTLLASSESNSEALVSEGVIPLLALAKSYDPQVQQNAAWVLLNLTQTVWSRRVLCRVGAVPVLTGLLHCSDSRVQFYGCSALGHLAAHAEHHGPLLQHAGERYLLQALLTLMSSPVQKEVLVSEGVFDVIGRTIQRHRSSGEVIAHTCTAVDSLSCSCLGRQALMGSECLSGLLQALVSTATPEDALIRLTSCLCHLLTFDALRSYVSSTVRSEEVSRLVQLSRPDRNQRLVYNCTAVISKLHMNEETRELLSRTGILPAPSQEP